MHCVTDAQVDALWKLAFAAQPQEPHRWRTRNRWEMVLRHSYAVSFNVMKIWARGS